MNFEKSPCKHSKSRLPDPFELKLGLCVPHDEYMNPNDLGGGHLRSTEVEH